VIRVLLADDQALIRAGFHVLIDAADDLDPKRLEPGVLQQPRISTHTKLASGR